MEFKNLLHSDSDRERGSSRSSRNGRRYKRRQVTLTSPSLVLKAFPGIPADVLCRLSELNPPTPSEVYKLVPEADPEDIAKFFDMMNGRSPSPQPRKEGKVPQPVKDSSSLVSELKGNRQDGAIDR